MFFFVHYMCTFACVTDTVYLFVVCAPIHVHECVSSCTRAQHTVCCLSFHPLLFFSIYDCSNPSLFAHQIYGKVPAIAKAVEAGCWSPAAGYSRPPM